MRAWCVVVPRSEGERVRLLLKDRGLLHKTLRIRQDGDRLYIPTIRRLDADFPTEERELEEGFTPIRSYKDIAQVPESVRQSLPSSFDVVGDIAVLKIPEDLKAYRDAIADAILRWNRRIRVVAQDRGVGGDLRVRRIEVIGGEPRTTTTHIEHSLRYRVDLSHAYFSPRLATERKRIADQVRDGEVVVDPFAGVGPYAILIARASRPSTVHAADANPAAVALLRANVAANRAERVEVQEADAHRVLDAVGPADRVILDLPHSAQAFLAAALRTLGPSGIVHLYRILERADIEDTIADIQRQAEREGFAVKDLAIRDVRAYSATQTHVALDLRVARG
jgi:tRNA (guanine37-N1)-methyltransferase